MRCRVIHEGRVKNNTLGFVQSQTPEQQLSIQKQARTVVYTTQNLSLPNLAIAGRALAVLSKACHGTPHLYLLRKPLCYLLNPIQCQVHSTPHVADAMAVAIAGWCQTRVTRTCACTGVRERACVSGRPTTHHWLHRCCHCASAAPPPADPAATPFRPFPAAARFVAGLASSS